VPGLPDVLCYVPALADVYLHLSGGINVFPAARQVFVRNGAVQTSDDRGEIAFMEFGSTGTCRSVVELSLSATVSTTPPAAERRSSISGGSSKRRRRDGRLAC
jgi:hypothetical protein